MSQQNPNSTHEPSFDDPVDPNQIGNENDSRYLAWLKLNPSGNFEQWKRESAAPGNTRTNPLR